MENEQEIIEKLIKKLCAYLEVPKNQIVNNKEMIYNLFLLSTNLDNPELLALQDEFLKKENMKLKKDFNFSQDVVLTFTNKLIPTLEDNNMDRFLVEHSGNRLILERLKIFKQDRYVLNFKQAFVCNAWNLNFKYVAIIVLDLSEKFEQNLISALENFCKQIDGLQVKTIAVEIKYLEEVNIKISRKIKKLLKNALKNSKISSKNIKIEKIFKY